MTINYFILSFVVLPLIGFFITFILPRNKEKLIANTAILITTLHLLTTIIFITYWTVNHFTHYNISELIIYQSKNYKFVIDFLFDKITATYLLVGSLITFLIVRYSRYYMHLENGYKRFFNTILFFFVGFNITLLSGNFETLFLGWEILGISSFLLIAFYRERYLPVRNALKVFSIYRIGDMGILAAMWATHHLWHENIRFIQLENIHLAHQFNEHNPIAIFIGLSILIAAAAKSAQFPFSSWLPRAMEGPTPSSSIFYGSLSVHFGVFLLLRTAPLWQDQIWIKILVMIIGLLTALIGNFISKVQSSIKPQIAYASVAQIGIMFIEIALGWHTIALIHFSANAFIRTYQLLISPSIINYLIRDQQFHFKPSPNNYNKIENLIYILSLKEWFLDDMMSYMFNTLKKGGKLLNFLTFKNVIYVFTPIYIVGLFLYLYPEILNKNIQNSLPIFFGLLGLLMVLKSFAERKNPRLVLILVILNHFSLALSVSFNENFDYHQTLIFLVGIIASGIIAYLVLNFMVRKYHSDINLYDYKGFIAKHPKTAFIYLIATLGLMGFPITPAFIGEDLLFSHIHPQQFVLGFLVAASFVISGITLLRMYARIFLGTFYQHQQSNPLKTA